MGYGTLNIIREHKIVLISGTPGIGKTSLANLLAYYILANGFQLIYNDGDVKEAESVFDNNPEAKQLFYFDDFLGANYMDILHDNRDKNIVHFVERIKSSKNKYLILTTRTTILNQAKTGSEVIDNSGMATNKFELSIDSYTKLDKARILYNHLYHRMIPQDYTDFICSQNRYWQIINHKNYNPRLIEFFTDESRISSLETPQDYFNFIIESLKNPSRIWEHAIEAQLSNEERMLLYTLLTMGQYGTTRQDLETAFNVRLEYEISHNGYTRGYSVFNKAFNNLLDGFIQHSITTKHESDRVNFINPSVRDYLISYFNTDTNEKWRLIESACYTQQIVQTYSCLTTNKANIKITDGEVLKFIKTINSLQLKGDAPWPTDDGDSLELCKYFCEFININTKMVIGNVIFERLSLIDFSKHINAYSPYIINVVEKTYSYKPVNVFVKENWDGIVENILGNALKKDDIEDLHKVFALYGVDYATYRRADNKWINIASTSIDRIYKFEADNIWREEQGNIMNEEDAGDLESRISDNYYDIAGLILPGQELEPNYNPLDGEDIDSIIQDNMRDNEELDFDQSDNVDYYGSLSETEIINDLFEK